MHLSTNPYLGKLFQGIQKDEFKAKFEELLKLVAEDDFPQNLEKLPHNIETKKIFESLGLNYERYINPDPALSRTFYDGNNLVEIRQVDMKDIKHSLFLGDQVGCCTSVESFKGYSAISYIVNSFIGAIEILVNGKPIGNTMILPILNKKLIVPVLSKKTINDEEYYYGEEEISLLVDDLKINIPYNTDKYLQEIAIFAQDIAKNIGIKDGKVYIGSSNTKEFAKKEKDDFHIYLAGKSLYEFWFNTSDTKNATADFREIFYIESLLPADKINSVQENTKNTENEDDFLGEDEMDFGIGDPAAGMGLH